LPIVPRPSPLTLRDREDELAPIGPAEREVAYDRGFKLSPLVEALDEGDSYGSTLVSMKRDWKTVSGPENA